MSTSPRQLTFRSGGWVLLLAGLVTVALAAWGLAPPLLGLARTPPGDGRTLESYRFDLSDLGVPRWLLVPAMAHRDMVPPMTEPRLFAGADIKAVNERRGKYIMPYDLVVGVEIVGEARAYPISVLNVHELIHDDLGGVPIAVTYHWPSASPMVFDRRVDGRVLELGISGLLYNSNMVLYDRRPAQAGGPPAPGGESLWSQLLARAISGEAARRGLELRVIGSELACWTEWLERHPATTVIDRDDTLPKRRYAKGDPDAYFQRGVLVYPVDPRPPREGPPPLTRVVTVAAGGERRVYPVPMIAERAAAGGVFRDVLGGVELAFEYCEPGRAVRVTAEEEITVRYALWFAWHAMFPEDRLVEGPSW
jgi:hypothetical protein